MAANYSLVTVNYDWTDEAETLNRPRYPLYLIG
jgi:hypothetical protein